MLDRVQNVLWVFNCSKSVDQKLIKGVHSALDFRVWFTAVSHPTVSHPCVGYNSISPMCGLQLYLTLVWTTAAVSYPCLSVLPYPLRDPLNDLFLCQFVLGLRDHRVSLLASTEEDQDDTVTTALDQIMAWRQAGAKPLSEPMMARWLITAVVHVHVDG